MPPRPVAETRIELFYLLAIWEVLAPLEQMERAIERRQVGDGRDRKRLSDALRRRPVAERMRETAHGWCDELRLSLWNDDRSRGRPERRGWKSELKSPLSI